MPAAMANPIQQGLKQLDADGRAKKLKAAMANPIQQGLKQHHARLPRRTAPGRNG